MEPTVSFFNCVSTHKAATEYSLQNIRSFYPDAYIMLACDACESYMDLCEKYQCEYLHCNSRLGYPVQPYGYPIEGVIDWLSRLYVAALRCGTDYIVNMEDDVILTRKLKIDPEWEVVCTPVDPATLKPESFLPSLLIDIIHRYSGVIPNVYYYGAGGGAILKVSTFIDNYKDIIKFFNSTGRLIQQHIYPTIGWSDCFTTVYYMLCGKPFLGNPRLTYLYDVYDYDIDVAKLAHHYDIICHYKKYY